MTKTLTEQWRDGKLKKGLYYARSTQGRKTISFHSCSRKHLFSPYTKYAMQTEEVLASVPSYDEYLYLKTNNDHWNKEAIRISKQASGIVLESDKLVQKMHILEKKLAIAMEALDAVSGDYNEAENLGYYFRKIEELDK